MRRTTLYAIIGVLSVALLISLIANAVQSSNNTTKSVRRSYITDTNRLTRSVRKPVTQNTAAKTKSKTVKSTAKAKNTTAKSRTNYSATRRELVNITDWNARLTHELATRQTPSTLPYYYNNSTRYGTNGAAQNGTQNGTQYGAQNGVTRGIGQNAGTNGTQRYEYRVLPNGKIAKTIKPNAPQNMRGQYSYQGAAVR